MRLLCQTSAARMWRRSSACERMFIVELAMHTQAFGRRQAGGGLTPSTGGATLPSRFCEFCLHVHPPALSHTVLYAYSRTVQTGTGPSYCLLLVPCCLSPRQYAPCCRGIFAIAVPVFFKSAELEVSLGLLNAGSEPHASKYLAFKHFRRSNKGG